jgi:hypothetical protein
MGRFSCSGTVPRRQCASVGLGTHGLPVPRRETTAGHRHRQRAESSFALRETLVDLFAQLPAKDQKRTPTSLVEDALRVPPHHLDHLHVRDLPPLRHGEVLSIHEREDRVRQLCPRALVGVGAGHPQVHPRQGEAASDRSEFMTGAVTLCHLLLLQTTVRLS